MKRIASLIVILVVLISCSSDDPKPQQLLSNIDMETGTSTPGGWGNNGSGGSYVTAWSTDEAASPSRSLKISSAVADAGNFWYWYQPYNDVMPKGKDLVLTVKIKGKNLTGSGVSIAIRVDRANTTTSQFSTTQGVETINGTFDWTEHKVRLNTVADDATKIWVWLIYLSNTTGEVYFDDANLVAQ